MYIVYRCIVYTRGIAPKHSVVIRYNYACVDDNVWRNFRVWRTGYHNVLQCGLPRSEIDFLHSMGQGAVRLVAESGRPSGGDVMQPIAAKG